MLDIIAIVIGQIFYPFCCDTCCAINFVHMWQMETPLEGIKPLKDGWQMLLPMWQVESHYERLQMLTANCGWWNSHIV